MTAGDELFVTGYLRSGTTLLEKILAQQEHVSMLSQPFPLLYPEAKRCFLRTLGVESDNPLGHLFGERRYTNDDLKRYLSQWSMSREMLVQLFTRMSAYSGQWTRFDDRALQAALDAVAGMRGFADVVSTLLHLLTTNGNARWFGSKETTGEELIPFLLDSGFRCLLILRDPRDVVASLNHGEGRSIAGDVRPTLFTIRAWRKSVAFAFACEAREHFAWCRYEDLVAAPDAVMKALALKTGVDLRPTDFSRLRDASGAEWTGNSSYRLHTGVSDFSVGSFREVLPPEVARFVEAACLPELQLLGYPTSLTRDDAARELHAYREPYAITRRGMDADLATEANAALEEERLDRLFDESETGIEPWFLFAEAHEKLRAHFRR